MHQLSRHCNTADYITEHLCYGRGTPLLRAAEHTGCTHSVPQGQGVQDTLMQRPVVSVAEHRAAQTKLFPFAEFFTKKSLACSSCAPCRYMGGRFGATRSFNFQVKPVVQEIQDID